MAKYRIVVDKELADIVPAYLEIRKKELPELQALLAAGNLDEARKIGHKLSGSGGGYGFDRLSDIGRKLEAAGLAGDAGAAAACVGELEDYLGNLEVVYE
jgi:HPt (histidine-containing phosphotransfer) domain-containing protein